MNMEDLLRLLRSQIAIFIYEILILAVLLVLIMILTKKRRQRKQIQRTAQERQVKQSLDDSLSNQRRR